MSLPPAYSEIPLDNQLGEDGESYTNHVNFIGKCSHNLSKIFTKNKSWRPISHSTSFLGGVLVFSLCLIAVVQTLLFISQNNDGILFSADISRLPLRYSFAYLYLPTIVAVLYSLMWSWVDLDTKRTEPYYQLSKPGSVSAADSVLLDYPFNFVASVPFKAIRSRHWPTFCVSIATLLVTWGLTPTQSGIFATDSITRNLTIDMARSTEYIPFANRQMGTYAESVYNLLWLNETLPPFTTRNYTLAPFGPAHNLSRTEDSESWTAPTTLYSVDLICVRPTETESDYILDGCSPFAKPGHPDQMIKTFSSMYVGYYYNDESGGGTGDNDWYLSDNCPKNLSHNFLAVWSSISWNTSSIASANETALWCAPTYYQQEVNATVAVQNFAVLDVVALGRKSAIPADLFNSTTFETAMSNGGENALNFVYSSWPDMTSHLQYMDLDLTYIPTMATYAVAAYQKPAASYLDPEVLRASYEAAYRLLFARSLSDVLESNLNLSTTTSGNRRYHSQSVIVIPLFVYVVEGLLTSVAIFTAIVFYLIRSRPTKLSSDPASLASSMSLVADDHSLLQQFKDYDKLSAKSVNTALEGTSFDLERDADRDGYRLVLKSSSTSTDSNTRNLSATGRRSTVPMKGVRPAEFRLWSGSLFIGFMMAISVLIAVAYVEASRLDGRFFTPLTSNRIPLPSKSRFVRQMVENYVPTVMATIIEPVWVSLTRLLCVLQPFEDLRKGNAKSSTTLSAVYTALPPQLVFLKAFRARHFLLGAVCCMSLLANVLAVSLSGLLSENDVPFSRASNFTTPSRPFLNASSLNSKLSKFGIRKEGISDQFYMYTSNLTAGTPLPGWTDNTTYYLPFNPVNGSNVAWHRKATTVGYGADMKCVPLESEGPNSVDANIYADSDGYERLLNLTARIMIGHDTCTFQEILSMEGFPNGRSASEVTISLCGDYILTGWMRANLVEQASKGGIVVTNNTGSDLTWSFQGCRASIKAAFYDVEVDGDGRVQKASFLRAAAGQEGGYFAQSNKAIIASIQELWAAGEGLEWHSDNSPSDFYNYFLTKKLGSSRFLNPSFPPPAFNETGKPFEELYSELVALTLSANADIMFPTYSGVASGSNINQETRIFVSKAMFIVSESILALYIAVSTLVYIYRPWRFLPRLPTTIASIISFFAASHALADLEGTSAMTTASRNHHLKQLGRYGYGSYIGTDGKAHVGIERQPFFAKLTKEPRRTAKFSHGEAKQAGTGPSRLRWAEWIRWKKVAHKDMPQEGGRI
ncbi:hypothetical protein K490DRAFT_33931 [Saccharata proteae CBS 121410]|uniref:Uncharacterized protein n=1 Tax=Saccharata proteae CBS 121410 TaxID=1314787 RepID=A0A9P4HWX5_9PEZI|nr:hypothetical protein K490DRAFT_33931 [Saccharata proteae CBS 121410]